VNGYILHGDIFAFFRKNSRMLSGIMPENHHISDSCVQVIRLKTVYIIA